MKAKQKIPGFMLAFCLVFTMLSVTPTAFAAENYGVTVKGIAVTSDNADDVLDDGTVSYDVNTNTLTLKNADLELPAEGESSSVIRLAGGINMELIGENTIVTFQRINAISGGGDITIQGSGSLDIKCEAGAVFTPGVLTIDGVSVTTTSALPVYGGLESHTGIVVKNNAYVDVTTNGGIAFQCLNPAENRPYISISDSSVSTQYGDSWGLAAAGDITINNSAITATGIGVAIGSEYGNGNIMISGGEMLLTSTGNEANGIYAAEGSVTVKDGAKLTASSGYPALYGQYEVKISDSEVNAAASNDVAVFSRGDIGIVNSVIDAEGMADADGIKANGSALVSGSWITTTGSETFENNITNSVLFNGTEGRVIGNATVIGDITIPEGATLIFPEGSGITVPNGAVFTNNGSISGNVNVIAGEGGTIRCGEGRHLMEEIKEEPASCTTDGKKAYYTCKTCHKYFADEVGKNEIQNLDEYGMIQAIGHKWIEPVWNWSEEGKSCTLTLTCRNNGEHTVELNNKDSDPIIEITSEVKNPATCTAKGTTTYTAKVTLDGQEYTETKDATDIALKDHNFQNGECTVCHEKAPDYPNQEIPGGTEEQPADPEQPSKPEGNPPEQPSKSEGNTPKQSKDNSDTKPADSPRTGDKSTPTLWFALLGVSAAGLAGTAVYRRKKK